MDDTAVLRSRIQSLLGDIRRAREGIEKSPLDDRMRTFVDGRFEVAFREQRKALDELQTDIKRNAPAADCWATFRGIEKACRPLFRECLDVLHGVLARHSGLDAGLARFCDALLDDLSERTLITWKGFTIPAVSEYYVELADIIRLKFPETSVWSWPVAAHELGHFVGPELRVRRSGVLRFPFQEMVTREKKADARFERFVHEHFGDVFATYALGPSYAATCLVLRFDPVAPTAATGTHPPDAERVHCILATLRRMSDANSNAGTYDRIITTLSNTWHKSVAAAGGQTVLDDTTARLDAWLEELYEILVDGFPAELCYDGWARAAALASQLGPDQSVPSKLPSDLTIADVLNAAWLCRLTHPQAGTNPFLVEQIGERAIGICRTL